MKKLFKAGMAVLVSLGFLFIPGDSVASQVRKSGILPHSISPVQVTGGCSISIRPYDTMLTPTIVLKVKGNPLTKQRVKADGKIVPEYQPGRYRETFKGYRVVPGKLVQISVEPSQRLGRINPRTLKYGKISATARVKVPMKFITPRLNAKIKVLPVRKLKITWTSGTGVGPMSFYIYEFTGPNQLAAKAVYENSGTAIGRVTVSTGIFKPDKKYGIYIFRKMGDFRLKQRMASGSRLSLRHSVATYIFTR